MPREKAIVWAGTRVLTRRGAWWVKTCPPVRNGVADVLACYRGWFIAFEFKQEGGVVSPRQNYELGKVNDAGGVAVVAHCPQDVADVLNKIDAVMASLDSVGT